MFEMVCHVKWCHRCVAHFSLLVRTGPDLSLEFTLGSDIRGEKLLPQIT